LGVLILLADSHYRPSKKVTDPESPADPLERSRFFDTMIEVIDVKTRKVIATRRFDEHLYFVGPGVVRTMRESDDGTMRFTLSKLRLLGYAGARI
jgi:hypothetical protein